MYGLCVTKSVNCSTCGNFCGYDRAVTQHTSYTKSKLRKRLPSRGDISSSVSQEILRDLRNTKVQHRCYLETGECRERNSFVNAVLLE